jgi:YVTN family beta-propeller protein
VVDAGGAGVPGISVTFVVSTGGGTLTGASTSTSAAGVATVGSWTLGTVAGAKTVTATARGNTGITVSSGAVNKAVSLTVAGRPSGASRTDVPESGQPFGVGVSVNDVLLVGEPFNNRVGRCDRPSRTLGTTTVVGADPDDIAFSPDGKTAYVTNVVSATLSVIDVATNIQTRAIAMPDPAYRVAMSGDGAKLYVTTAVR